MIKKIEVLFQIIKIYLLFLSTTNFYAQKNGDNKIIEFQKILAREYCSDHYDLCSDGMEPIRMEPYLINYNEEFPKYDTVFIPPVFVDDIKYQEIMNQFNTLDVLFAFEENLDNSIFIRNKKLCRQINRYYKKNKIPKIKNCDIRYDIYNVHFKALRLGNKRLFYIDFNNSCDHVFRKSETFVIMEIDSIIPFIIDDNHRILNVTCD